MTDSHCHLDYCDDPEAAADPSLTAIVTVGTTPERSRAALELSARFPNVWAAVGIHPNDAALAEDEGARAATEALAREPRAVAIGETGVDLYWDRASLEQQRAAFRWQVSLARDLSKPLILHVRDKDGREDAALEAARLIAEAGHPKGVLHCFSGHPSLLETGLELGWMVSFAGNLTYKSARALHAAAQRIPQDRLLVETDSPFLAPVPLRGKRNVPANMRHTLRALADLRGEAPAVTEGYTDENAARLYGLEQLGQRAES
jgi:TatD DNase family protein